MGKRKQAEQLNFCPFCGNDAIDDDGFTFIDGRGPFKIGQTAPQPDDILTTQVVCKHCSARGSVVNGDEGDPIKLVREIAIKNWNEAERPGWWFRNVTRRWWDLEHQFSCWIYEWKNR